jgi:hypothetical protein
VRHQFCTRGRQARHRLDGEGILIANDEQLNVTLERISWFQKQVVHLRKTETNPANEHGAVSGFLAEIDQMQLEVREYFTVLPKERVAPPRFYQLVITVSRSQTIQPACRETPNLRETGKQREEAQFAPQVILRMTPA